jgi:MFS family permease/GNAT superfamily N-acetyltransferase
VTGRAATALAAGTAPLRDGRFVRLLAALAVSALGNSGTRVALAWLVVVELRAGAQLSLVLAAYTVPQFFVGLVGGVLADRHDARLLARGGFLASGLTLSAMALLGQREALGLATLAVLVVVAGTAFAVAQPAVGAMLVSLVDERSLGPANSLRIIAMDTAAVVGPAAAGLVIAASRAHIWFLVDAVTFLAAALVLPAPRRRPAVGPAAVGAAADGPGKRGSVGGASGHRIRPGTRRRAAREQLREAVAGARFVAGRLELWTGMAAAGLGNLLITVPLLVCVPALVGVRGLGSGALGAFFALFTAGSVLGAAEAGLLPRARTVPVALAFLLLAGVGVALIGVRPDPPVLLWTAVAIGFCIADFDVRWAAHLQGAVPREIVARVLACDAWVSFVCRTAGLSTIGLLAVHNAGGLLVVCGLVMAGLAGALSVLLRRPTRTAAPADLAGRADSSALGERRQMDMTERNQPADAFSADDVVIRTAGAEDLDTLLALLDDAVRWLNADGYTGQWGTKPFSTEPGGIAQATNWVTEDTLFLAWLGDRPVGALAIGDPPPFVPPPVEPELYLTIQVVDHAYKGRNVSGLMMERAKELARARGAKALRGDCYAGEGGAVVRHYQRLGFEVTGSFTVDTPDGPWQGQTVRLPVD